MKKYKFDACGYAREKKTPEGILAEKISARMLDGGWYGTIWEEDGIIRIHCPGIAWVMKDLIQNIVGMTKKPDTLPTLANEVYDAICDTNTKKAFRKFADLLIEKLEKK